MILLRDIVDISNNLKRSSNYKGKIGKIRKLLHNLALIGDSLFLSSLSGSRKKDGEWRCKAPGHTPVPTGVLGPRGSTALLDVTLTSGLPSRGTRPEGVGDGGTEGHGPTTLLWRHQERQLCSPKFVL